MASEALGGTGGRGAGGGRAALARAERWLERRFAGIAFGEEERIVFYEQLENFVEDGMSAFDALSVLHLIFNDERDVRRQITGDVLDGIRRGLRLGEAFGGWIPDSERMLIAVGEEVGNLAQALREVQFMMRRKIELSRALRENLLPPALYMLAVYGFVFFIASHVVPQFKSVIPPTRWPPFGRLYFGVMDFARDYSPFIVTVVVMLVAWMVWTMPRVTGAARARMDRLFPWTTYRAIQSSYFLIALSSMMRSGIALDRALRTLLPFASLYLASHMERMLGNIKRGLPDGMILNTGMLPKAMANDARAYGETSRFDKGIDAMGRRAADKTAREIRAVAGRLNFVVVLLIGVFVITTLYAAAEVMMVGADTLGGAARR